MDNKHRPKQDLMAIIPNLFTASSLACGFSCMMFALSNRFYGACILIVAAAIFDSFDGRVARLLDRESDFGAEFDSLCDLVSFGVAPVILAFKFCLFKTGSIAWGVCFFYLVSSAMRLAKFNLLRHDQDESKSFSGLPSPMAAMTICAAVLLFEYLQFAADISLAFSKVVIGLLMVFVSSLMISRFSYPSFKNISVSPKMFKVYMISMMVLLTLIVMEPILSGSVLVFIYTLSGPLTYLSGKKSPNLGDELI